MEVGARPFGRRRIASKRWLRLAKCTAVNTTFVKCMYGNASRKPRVYKPNMPIGRACVVEGNWHIQGAAV